jgi:hypothetical protein
MNLFELALRRVYLFSLQQVVFADLENCPVAYAIALRPLYFLSVALVLTLRWTGVTRYAAI